MHVITAMGTFLVAATLLSNVLLVADEASAQPAGNVRCNGCIHTRDLANDAVTAGKIRNNAIRKDHLTESAQPAGADFSAPPVDIGALPGTDTVVTSVRMNLPGRGVVILNSGGFAVFNTNPSGFVCAIKKGTTIGDAPLVVGQNHNETNARRMPVATTRGFLEAAGGNKTYNFVCHAQGSTSLFDVILTAVFAPQRY
jgi:hypothetical protein